MNHLDTDQRRVVKQHPTHFPPRHTLHHDLIPQRQYQLDHKYLKQHHITATIATTESTILNIREISFLRPNHTQEMIHQNRQNQGILLVWAPHTPPEIWGGLVAEEEEGGGKEEVSRVVH